VELSISDWIYHGPGQLNAGVFLSRVLLFRLYEHNCSVLVYHEPNVTSNVIDKDARTISYKVTDPEAIYVHFVPDSNIALDELRKVEPLRLALSQDIRGERVSGHLGIQIEPHGLPANGMVDFGWERSGTIEYPIANSAYCVQSPVPLLALGKEVPASDARLKCWRVIFKSENGPYDLVSPRDWSLSAFNIQDASRPTFLMRRRGARVCERVIEK
jgi:hypothetical protein